jgi:kynurenine formamidase
MVTDNATWLDYFKTCSNNGRWGPDDQRGTLNYITPDRVLDAIRTVDHGVTVSLGYDLPIGKQPLELGGGKLRILHEAGSKGVSDVVTVAPHGFAVTHMDALGHVGHEGHVYNGRQLEDIVSDQGMKFGAVTAMASGIMARGVLLDIAGTRGVPTLVEGEGISVDDLLAAEAKSGTTVQSGDALFLRSGIGQDPRWLGPATIGGRPGVLPEVIPWLYERQVAVYSGDCIERLPSIGDKGDLPLHEIGLAAMGLAMLDNPNVEALRAACQTYGRAEFLLVVAPLRIPGGTGSALNPLAVF